MKHLKRFAESLEEDFEQEQVEYFANIDEDTVNNDNYRKEIYTGSQMQITLMSLEPGEEIGEEVHEEGDQFFRIEKGVGTLVIDGEEKEFETDFGFTVTAGKNHNIINTGKEVLKLYSIYAPPEHAKGTLHQTKDDDDHDH
jgi:mannose-6-phosphate isomerase-like protein (cupin superfamily)